MFYFDKDNYADESIINEHGGTFGVKDDPLKHPLPEEFVPETDIQAARRDAGLSTVGIRDDGTDYYGTSNEEYKSIVDYLQNTISGEGIQEKMSVLPPKSIEKIVEHRTVKALNEFDEFNTFNIDDKEWLAEKIGADIALINAVLDMGYNPTINATNMLGEYNMQNLAGILELYKQKIAEKGFNFQVTGLSNTDLTMFGSPDIVGCASVIQQKAIEQMQATTEMQR